MKKIELGDVVEWNLDADIWLTKSTLQYRQDVSRGPFVIVGLINQNEQCLIKELVRGPKAEEVELNHYYTARFKRNEFLTAARKAILESGNE